MRVTTLLTAALSILAASAFASPSPLAGWVAVLRRVEGAALAPVNADSAATAPPSAALTDRFEQGADRFQQGVDYQIEARLDEFRQALAGRMRLTYTNHSRDTLRNLYLHLYLNAFRPNSIWAREERRPWLDFQNLKQPDYAYNRLGRVAVSGREVTPRYPYRPDSTVVQLELPAPLPPGARIVVSAEWEARPSTLPRRQGRAGRHWDFAHWYPKIAVYDRGGWQARPLHPQGEFYGEFANYDVTLETLADQVIAATGLPVSGDPGWERASSAGGRVTYRRDYYSDAAQPRPALGLLGELPPRGYKRTRWRAERVHHFAWAADPMFRYEEGRYGEAIVRVLYRPEEESGWSGVAVANAVKALAWLDTIFGPYVYPQLTISRRIDGGGTEFPMLVMQSGASEGLTIHEVGHQYVYGILANNEWKEGWLDEGFTTFQSRWYMERRYGPYGSAPAPHGYAAKKLRPTMREDAELQVLRLDLDGWSQPVATIADEFREFALYSRMIYTKGSLIFDLLRYVMGEATFRRFLRTFYSRWKLRHVNEDAFRRTAEQVCGCDLGWFFHEWLHTTQLVDYAIGDIRVAGPSAGDTGYVTTVDVVKKAEGTMPVEVAMTDAAGHEHRARASGSTERERVTFRTRQRPGAVAVDPDDRILDWNPSNNRPSRFRWLPVYGGHADDVFDWPFLEQRRRDRRVRAWLPLVWYNSADKLVLGLRARANLMGWLADEEAGAAHGVGRGTLRPHLWMRWRNPLWWRAPRREHELALWYVEGRSGASLRVEWDRSPWLQFGPQRRRWLELTVMDADASGGYLPPGRWAPAATAELGFGYREGDGRAGFEWRWQAGGSVGAYRRDGGSAGGDRSGAYVRGSAELQLSRVRRDGLFVGLRLFAGGVAAPRGLPEQRRFFVAGAGPYEVFGNPFLRSRGSPFRLGEVRYFAPGDAGLRAYRVELGGRWALAGTVRVGARLGAGGAGRVELSAFADAGVVDGERVAGPVAPEALGLTDFGPGLALSRRVGDSSVRLSVDWPVYAVRPDLAADSRGGRWGFRWTFTLDASL